MIRAVTLDCAETLVKVRWAPGSFALDCAAAAGLRVEEGIVRPIYERLVLLRWNEYIELNKRRDPEQCIDWWRKLTLDWLNEIGADPRWLQPVMEASYRLLYEPPDKYFELFDDVRPALEGLGRRGLRLGVLSNWDYSLHRVLDAHDLGTRFEHVLASLEEGVEKPDARLFAIAAARFDLRAEEILHVGDNQDDDLNGAIGAGFQAVLLDRSTSELGETTIPSLSRLPEWIDRRFPG